MTINVKQLQLNPTHQPLGTNPPSPTPIFHQFNSKQPQPQPQPHQPVTSTPTMNQSPPVTQPSPVIAPDGPLFRAIIFQFERRAHQLRAANKKLLTSIATSISSLRSFHVSPLPPPPSQSLEVRKVAYVLTQLYPLPRPPTLPPDLTKHSRFRHLLPLHRLRHPLLLLVPVLLRSRFRLLPPPRLSSAREIRARETTSRARGASGPPYRELPTLEGARSAAEELRRRFQGVL